MISILILSEIGSSVAWAGRSSVCARYFERFGERNTPALQKFEKNGLRGLSRSEVLEVESHLGGRKLGMYSSTEILNQDVGAYFELQCLKYGSNCKELLAWWKTHSSEYTQNPRFLRIIADDSFSVQGLADLASAQFYQQVGKTKGSVWRERFAWMVNPTALATVAWTVTFSVAAKIASTIYNAATLGTMMKLWNAYTDATVAPIEAHLKRQGTRDLGKFSFRIQEWLTRRSEVHQHLEEMKKRAEAASKTLESGALTQVESEKLWADFQTYFYGKFMAFNQSLPSNMREGRAFIYATEFAEPLAIANFISGRYDAFRESKRRIATIEERYRGATPTASDRQTLEDERRYLEITRRQVAAGLAGFLIRKYMYRDDAFKRVTDPSKNPSVALDDVQKDLIDGLGIQFFLHEFLDQLLEQFKQYEMVFKAADLDAYTEIQEKSSGG